MKIVCVYVTTHIIEYRNKMLLNRCKKKRNHFGRTKRRKKIDSEGDKKRRQFVVNTAHLLSRLNIYMCLPEKEEEEKKRNV